MFRTVQKEIDGKIILLVYFGDSLLKAYESKKWIDDETLRKCEQQMNEALEDELANAILYGLKRKEE